MTKEKQRTYEFLGNIMVSLMDTDILITYPFLKTELHISSRDLSAMKKGSNMCIYQYVRVVSCITEQIHLGILYDSSLQAWEWTTGRMGYCHAMGWNLGIKGEDLKTFF